MIVPYLVTIPSIKKLYLMLSTPSPTTCIKKYKPFLTFHSWWVMGDGWWVRSHFSAKKLFPPPFSSFSLLFSSPKWIESHPPHTNEKGWWYIWHVPHLSTLPTSHWHPVLRPQSWGNPTNNCDSSILFFIFLFFFSS
jgi:hypothetical protein